MSLYHHKTKTANEVSTPSATPSLDALADAAEAAAAELAREVPEFPAVPEPPKPLGRTRSSAGTRPRARYVEYSAPEYAILPTRKAAKSAAKAMSEQMQLEAFDLDSGLEVQEVVRAKPKPQRARAPPKPRKPRQKGRRKRKAKKPPKPKKQYASVAARRRAELYKFAERNMALSSSDEDNKGRKKSKNAAKIKALPMNLRKLTGKKLAQALAKLRRPYYHYPIRGLSRRALTKKIPRRASNKKAQAFTSDSIYYHGQHFFKGDVVSVQDIGGDIFYGQLRGFLTDQFLEKSGVIAWLVPSAKSPDPNEMFDPTTYTIGPIEELPRKMEVFTFVMNAPDDYFYFKQAPYETDAIPRDHNYLLVRMEPRIRCVNAKGETYFVPSKFLNATKKQANTPAFQQTAFKASPDVRARLNLPSPTKEVSANDEKPHTLTRPEPSQDSEPEEVETDQESDEEVQYLGSQIVKDQGYAQEVVVEVEPDQEFESEEVVEIDPDQDSGSDEVVEIDPDQDSDEVVEIDPDQDSDPDAVVDVDPDQEYESEPEVQFYPYQEYETEEVVEIDPDQESDPEEEEEEEEEIDPSQEYEFEEVVEIDPDQDSGSDDLVEIDPDQLLNRQVVVEINPEPLPPIPEERVFPSTSRGFGPEGPQPPTVIFGGFHWPSASAPQLSSDDDDDDDYYPSIPQRGTVSDDEVEEI